MRGKEEERRLRRRKTRKQRQRKRTNVTDEEGLKGVNKNESKREKEKYALRIIKKG